MGKRHRLAVGRAVSAGVQGLDFMAAPTGLLERLAALRQRLAAVPAERELRSDKASPHQQLLILEHKVHQLRAANGRLEQGLRALDEAAAEPEPSPPAKRFSWRVRRLLLRGRQMLDQLRALMPTFSQGELADAAPGLVFSQTQALADFALRSAEHWPEAAALQDRLADGLEAQLEALEGRLRQLMALQERWREAQARLDAAADAIQQLHQGKLPGLSLLRPLALKLIDEEALGAPLKWWSLDPDRPARWAAAAGLNAALVVVRIVKQDPEWAARQLDAVLAALLADAGMATLPAELLGKKGPLDDAERRQMESHVAVADEALKKALPHEGWLHEALRQHHERPNGTGYPAGCGAAELGRLGKLLAAASTYASLCTPRPWRPALGPRAALTETLLDAERGRLDIPAAERLLQLGPYPTGTIVELSDGSFAQVAGPSAPEGPRPPHRPIVALLRDAKGKPIPFVEHLDLARVASRQIVKGFAPNEARRLVGVDALDLW